MEVYPWSHAARMTRGFGVARHQVAGCDAVERSQMRGFRHMTRVWHCGVASFATNAAVASTGMAQPSAPVERASGARSTNVAPNGVTGRSYFSLDRIRRKSRRRDAASGFSEKDQQPGGRPVVRELRIGGR